SSDYKPTHGSDAAADGDPDGRPRESVERARRHLVDEHPPGGHGERHRVGHRVRGRRGGHHRDERRAKRVGRSHGDARERFDTALLTYISDTKWGAKIYGSDCSPITNDGDYVQIINFDVTGSCNQGITTNGNYSRIIGNRVHDMPGTALTGAIVGACCDYRITGIQIIGNVVDNIGPWGQVNQTHGIYVAGPYAVVQNNIVTRAASACIQSYHGATHQIISNNIVANCGVYGIQISA